MEKKLTAQGPRDRKSYTVTLPKEWVKKEKLDELRLVELKVVGNKLVISPSKEIQEEAIINADDYNKSLIKVIPGLYRLGINKIRINLLDNNLLEKIIEIINKRLIGYEIIEQRKDFIIVKDITKESGEDFKTILRRVFLLLLELSNSEDAVQVRTLDKNIKRLINYCQRILIKNGHTEFLRTPLYYLLLDQLEKIGDELKWILSIKRRKEILDKITKVFRQGYEVFYKFDPKKFDEYSNKAYQLKNEIRLGDKINTGDMYLHNLARLINSLSGTMLMIRFND